MESQGTGKFLFWTAFCLKWILSFSHNNQIFVDFFLYILQCMIYYNNITVIIVNIIITFNLSLYIQINTIIVSTYYF